LCAQLERRELLIRRRREIFAGYRKRLEGIPGLSFQPVADWAEAAPWLFSITVDEARFGRSRDELSQYLAMRNIETRPFFIPLHTLPPYREESKKRSYDLPITFDLARRGMNLPTFTSLLDSDLDLICNAIRSAKVKKR